MTEELIESTAATGPFFKFTDEETWLAAARSADFMMTITDEDGNEIEQLEAYTHSRAIDVIGKISVGGEWDEDGVNITAPTELEGFHVNYVGDLPDGWESFAVSPKSPYRVFA